MFFCRAWFPKYMIHPYRNTNPGQILRVCSLCLSNILFKTNTLDLGVVLSWQVSELQVPTSPGHEPKTVIFSRACGLRSYNMLFETNNCFACTILPSYLVTELQEPPSSGLELRTTFRNFDLSEILFLASRSKHAKFDTTWLSVLGL